MHTGRLGESGGVEEMYVKAEAGPRRIVLPLKELFLVFGILW